MQAYRVESRGIFAGVSSATAYLPELVEACCEKELGERRKINLSDLSMVDRSLVSGCAAFFVQNSHAQEPRKNTLRDAILESSCMGSSPHCG